MEPPIHRSGTPTNEFDSLLGRGSYDELSLGEDMKDTDTNSRTSYDHIDWDGDDDTDAESYVNGNRNPKMIRSSSALPTRTSRFSSINEMIDFDNFKKTLKRPKTTKLDRPSQTKGLLMFVHVLLFPVYTRTWMNLLPTSTTLVFVVLYSVQLLAYGMVYMTPRLQADQVTYFESTFPILMLVVIAWIAGHCRAVSSMRVFPNGKPLELDNIIQRVKQQAHGVVTREESNGNMSTNDDDTSDDDDDEVMEGDDSNYESEVDRRFSRRPQTRPKSTPIDHINGQRIPLHGVQPVVAIAVTTWKGVDVSREKLKVSEIREKIHKKVESSNKASRRYAILAKMFALIIGAIPGAFRLVSVILPVICRKIEMYDGEGLLYSIFASYGLCTAGSKGGQKCDPQDVFCVVEMIQTNFYDAMAMEKMFISSVALFSNTILSIILFRYAAHAEDAFRRRMAYVKYFSKLTSARRARKSGLPHFRLNRVQHIRGWLELRHDSNSESNTLIRSGDGAATVLQIITMIVVGYTCVRMFVNLWDPREILDWATVCLSVFLSVFLFHLMDLASQTNKKFNTAKILYTEQMNLYIRMFSNPTNRDELFACNNMIKIAIKLLKEVDGGSGKDKVKALMLHPVVYNLFRITILSAIGTASSELFGFKVRLWKL